MRKITLLILLFVYATSIVCAGGYQVRLQGQRQTGMGLIGTPFAFGASSIFFNPGSLTFMERNHDLEMGISIIKSNVTFQKSYSNYQTQTDNPLKPPFYIYGAKRISEKVVIGFGIYTPFGSTTQWDDDWVGKMLIQDISLKAIYFQPTLSYKINDHWGIGLGFVYAMGEVSLKKGLPYSSTSSASLNGKTSNIGYNIGLYYQNEKFSFGIDYRSKIQMKMEDGEATFNIPTSLQTIVPPNNTFNAKLPMPANLDFGIAYKVDDKLTLAAEFGYVFWGTYENLAFSFTEKGELLNSVNPRKYKNTLIVRIGGMYKLNKKLTLSAGAYYDPTPSNDEYYTPETVTLNTIAFTLGATYMVNEKLEITVTYLQTNGLESEKAYKPANFSGSYKSLAAIPGFGISYHF